MEMMGRLLVTLRIPINEHAEKLLENRYDVGFQVRSNILREVPKRRATALNGEKELEEEAELYRQRRIQRAQCPMDMQTTSEFERDVWEYLNTFHPVPNVEIFSRMSFWDRFIHLRDAMPISSVQIVFSWFHTHMLLWLMFTVLHPVLQLQLIQFHGYSLESEEKKRYWVQYGLNVTLNLYGKVVHWNALSGAREQVRGNVNNSPILGRRRWAKVDSDSSLGSTAPSPKRRRINSSSPSRQLPTTNPVAPIVPVAPIAPVTNRKRRYTDDDRLEMWKFVLRLAMTDPKDYFRESAWESFPFKMQWRVSANALRKQFRQMSAGLLDFQMDLDTKMALIMKMKVKVDAAMKEKMEKLLNVVVIVRNQIVTNWLRGRC